MSERVYPSALFKATRGRTASYVTASKKRERWAVRARAEQFLDACDPRRLLARPVDERGWQRLVDRLIELERSGLGLRPEDMEKKHLRPKVGQTRADRVIEFIETFCSVPEGPHAGEAMRLEDFEKDFIREVFDNPDKTSLAILSMAKKNGKSGLIAALLVAFLAGPEVRFINSQIVSGAMEREQAAIIFKYASKMCMSPVLQYLVNPIPSRKTLYGLARNIEFRSLANVARSTHGISPVVAILDEIGQVQGPTSDFVDAVSTSQGAYTDGMLFVISTQAADDADLLSIMIDNAFDNPNPHTVCHLYTAPPDCDVQDKEAWAEANPGLGTIRSLPDMENLARNAADMPSTEARFRNLNLNQRNSTMASGFCTEPIWKENGKEPTQLDGRTVYGGLDLASTSDLCSLELIDKHDYSVHSFFWLPKVGLKEKGKRDKKDYEKWEKDGLLFTTPGRTVQYEHVAEFLRGVFDRCTVEKLGFDKQYMNHLQPWLVKAGFTEKELEKFVEFRQGFLSMGPAVRSFETMLLEAKLRHGNNPILRSCAKNAIVVKDPAGNQKFDKQRSRGRIDGMVALAMAIGVIPTGSEGPPKKYQVVVI